MSIEQYTHLIIIIITFWDAIEKEKESEGERRKKGTCMRCGTGFESTTYDRTNPHNRRQPKSNLEYVKSESHISVNHLSLHYTIDQSMAINWINKSLYKQSDHFNVSFCCCYLLIFLERFLFSSRRTYNVCFESQNVRSHCTARSINYSRQHRMETDKMFQKLKINAWCAKRKSTLAHKMIKNSHNFGVLLWGIKTRNSLIHGFYTAPLRSLHNSIIWYENERANEEAAKQGERERGRERALANILYTTADD